MEVILSAIASGGIIGAADQYLCLLLVAVAGKTNIIQLSPEVGFMESWWFIGIVAAFWLLTVAPAYSTALAPGVMNAVNTVVNFISGFIVPLSAGLITLASMGVISSLYPDFQQILETLRLFNADGSIGSLGYLTAGGGAVAATSLTAIKALAKPALSTSTGTVGTTSAPIFTSLENIASLILMGLTYLFTQLDPRLVIVLFAVTALALFFLSGYSVYRLWKLKKGVGRVLYLTQKHPRAGLAIITEAIVWGTGWFAWKYWARGAVMLLLLVVWVAVFLSVQAIVAAALAFVPPLIPVGVALVTIVLVMGYILIGINSAGALMKTIEKEIDLEGDNLVATAGTV